MQRSPLEERVAGSTGNPRDGYGYELDYRLAVFRPEGPLHATLRGGGWEPSCSDFRVELGAISLEQLAVRAVLRTCFGAETDRRLAGSAAEPASMHASLSR